MSAPRPERLGRYRIVGEIGRGAMGVVYRGEDESLGRTVAVKTILASMDADEHADYLARFRQEARAVGGLNHPALITVFEFGDEAGLAYMAMEYLDGRELRDVLLAERLPVAAAVEIAAQVAEGLAFAHSRGVVHRDIKPANIMVLDGNRAKVMDFGIARVRTSDVKTQTGMLLGSPKYMSPEQVLGRGIDHRADIFSLGVVLYEMLAGAPPFGGNDIHQLMYQVCHARPAPPSRLNPAVPQVLDLIVAKALEKAPDARYQDAAQLAADLRGCMEAIDEAASVGGATLVQSADDTMPLDAQATLAQRAQATPAEGTQVTAAERTQAASVERTQATLAERTQAMTTATLVLPAVGLHVSRRFPSQAAIQRLAAARGDDRVALSPAGLPSTLLSRLLADRPLMAAGGAIAAALILAAVIAL